jgi:hypothetical protein
MARKNKSWYGKKIAALIKNKMKIIKIKKGSRLFPLASPKKKTLNNTTSNIFGDAGAWIFR